MTANHSGAIENVEARLLVIFGYCMRHTASSNRSPLQDLIDNSVNIWEHWEVSNDGRASGPTAPSSPLQASLKTLRFNIAARMNASHAVSVMSVPTSYIVLKSKAASTHAILSAAVDLTSNYPEGRKRTLRSLA